MQNLQPVNNRSLSEARKPKCLQKKSRAETHHSPFILRYCVLWENSSQSSFSGPSQSSQYPQQELERLTNCETSPNSNQCVCSMNIPKRQTHKEAAVPVMRVPTRRDPKPTVVVAIFVRKVCVSQMYSKTPRIVRGKAKSCPNNELNVAQQ